MGEHFSRTAPFGDVPPTWESPLGVAAWLTEPLGVVTVMMRPIPIDDRLADFLIGDLHREVRALAPPELATYALHDWSLATSYDARSRLRLTRWVVAHRHEHVATGVVPPSQSSPLRMGAEVALGVLKLAGIAFELVDEPALWIARHGLVARRDRGPVRAAARLVLATR